MKISESDAMVEEMMKNGDKVFWIEMHAAIERRIGTVFFMEPNRKNFPVDGDLFVVTVVDGRIYLAVDGDPFILAVAEARSLVAALVAAANEATP